jgi:hypothetical protein
MMPGLFHGSIEMKKSPHVIIANLPQDLRDGLSRAARHDYDSMSGAARRLLRDGLVARGFIKPNNDEGGSE